MQQVQQEQIILPIGSVVRNVSGDRYTIEGLLGKGGTGAVYLVQDRRNKQDVFALKELIDPDKLGRERFAFEAEVLMRLDHDALPRVYRVFENDKLKRVYILMDYIEGQDLEALRKEEKNQRFELPLVLALLTPIVDALSYLHHREPPIVHRDIKPANIVKPVKGGDAMLVDFGIAKEYTNDGTTTVIRHGTPGYAALEQYGGGTNTRTDVYGLAATLYTLLTGTIPVDALTRVTGNQGADSLKPAHELVPELPLGVSNAISRAMSTIRDDRFASIDEFWEELKAHENGPKASDINVSDTEASNSLKGSDTTDKLVSSSKILATGRHIARTRKNISSMTLDQQRQILQKEKRQLHLLTIFGVFLALLLVGGGITWSILHTPHTISAHTYTPIASQKTLQVPPTATPTIDQSPYPTLATAYVGTMHDYLNGNAVNSSLSGIQQNYEKIQGSCNCLGLTGLFTGTVGTDGSITFTMKMIGRGTNMLFQGHIKTGGDMAGQFYILNASDGQHTGEFGDWSFKNK